MTTSPQLDRRRLAAGVGREPTEAERRRAALAVAGRAHDTADCAELLAMLGLLDEAGDQTEEVA